METALRLKILDLIGTTADVREMTTGFVESDRDYIAREMEKAQAAAHRVLAFLDAVEGHEKRM
jgi:hypothetical protein